MTVERMTIKERLGDWIEVGPLRRWRHRLELSMMDAATFIGVSLTSVQLWEQGSNYPSEANVEKMAAAMEVQPETLARSLKQWYAQKPTVGD